MTVMFGLGLFEENSLVSGEEHRPYEPRVLNGGKPQLQLSSPGMIAWYCFIASLLVPSFICFGYIWYTKYRSNRRAQMALERERRLEEDLALSRIEANVQVFSDAEKCRRTKLIRSALRKYTKVYPNPNRTRRYMVVVSSGKY